MKLSTMLLPTGEFIFVASEANAPTGPNMWNEFHEKISAFRERIGAVGLILTSESVEIDNALIDENAVRRNTPQPGPNPRLPEDQLLADRIAEGAEFSPAGLVKSVGGVDRSVLTAEPRHGVVVDDKPWEVGEVDPEEQGVEPEELQPAPGARVRVKRIQGFSADYRNSNNGRTGVIEHEVFRPSKYERETGRVWAVRLDGSSQNQVVYAAEVELLDQEPRAPEIKDGDHVRVVEVFGGNRPRYDYALGRTGKLTVIKSAYSMGPYYWVQFDEYAKEAPGDFGAGINAAKVELLSTEIKDA